MKTVFSITLIVFTLSFSYAQKNKPEEIKRIPRPMTVNKNILKGYMGKYEMTSTPGRFALINEEEGFFIIDMVKTGKFELAEKTTTLFEIVDVKPSATLEFVKDKSGKVTRFIVNQKGKFEWEKVE
jgi:hypothetical protein